MIRARLRSLSPVELRFAVAAFIGACGTGCFLAGSAIFTRELGLTPGLVGVGLTLSGVLGLASTVPWERAADRWGARRVLVLLLLVRGLAFMLYAFASSVAAFLAIAALLGLVDKATSPIQQALIGEAVGDARRQHALALVRSTRNVGFALGSLVAAAAVTDATPLGYDAIAVLNAASFALAALLMHGQHVASHHGDSRRMRSASAVALGWPTSSAPRRLRTTFSTSRTSRSRTHNGLMPMAASSSARKPPTAPAPTMRTAPLRRGCRA